MLLMAKYACIQILHIEHLIIRKVWILGCNKWVQQMDSTEFYGVDVEIVVV